MDIIIERRSYKYFRTESSEICNFNFHSLVPNCKNNSYKNRQNCCPFLFGKNRRNSKSVTCTDQQGNLRIFTGQGDHNYCRVPPRSPQQGGWHAVTNREGFKQEEIKSSGVSIPLQILVNSRDRPFPLQSSPSSSSLCLLETGFIQQRQECSSNLLNSHERICSSPIFSNGQSLTQSFDRSSNVTFDNTSMENQVLVPSVTKALDSKPFDFAQSTRFVTRPKQETSSSNNKRKLRTPGMDSFRERLSSEEISVENATVIANARRSSTITHCESSWHKWHSWCVRRQTDPIWCPLSHILDFLTKCFHEGFQFNILQDLGLQFQLIMTPLNALQ